MEDEEKTHDKKVMNGKQENLINPPLHPIR